MEGKKVVFRGSAQARLDSQGRLKIPSTYRKLFSGEYGARVFITSTDGKSLRVYPLENWIRIEEKLLEMTNSSSVISPEKQEVHTRTSTAVTKFQTFTSVYGLETNLDKQGRASISVRLKNSMFPDGEFDCEVTVIGRPTYLEVWKESDITRKLEAIPISEEDSSILATYGI